MNSSETVEWLRRFYARPGNSIEIPGDNLGTTCSLSTAIALALVLTGTRSPEKLADFLGLPVAFIAVVIGKMDYNQLWTSESFQELCRTLEAQADDYDKIDAVLNWFVEDFW